MENRNEPLSAAEWLKSIGRTQPITLELMQAYADYIKSFQPESSPIDWEKLEREYNEEWKDALTFDWFKQRIG